MVIRLDDSYNAMVSTALLGYVGETNARPVTFEGMEIDGADRYILTIDYGDGVAYEVDITGGQWTPTADILRSAQTVSCQIAAKKLSGDEYILVKKSRIFRLRIGAAIGDTAIPSPDVAMDALDRIETIGRQVEEDVSRAENAASTAMAAAETLVDKADSAEKSAQRAEQARDTAVSAEKTATQAMETAVMSADTAQKSADTAVKSADSAQAASKTAVTSAEQAHADMQTAQTAAETATTAEENAAKSATAAGVSADTAGQAAERAETAQTAAETSATQADTARQDAETAHQQAVTAQNNAKISADLAASAAQQTTADKTATAGYAETAKTNADSATVDRQAVQEMAAQVTADKSTVAENTAKVAEDRTAAEAAAQTAQAVADSLPDDYTTAVGKIAENTADIAAVKLTDKELQRRVNALYDMGNGVTHRFETDTETAYVKTVPSGGKLMSVKNVGGRSIVWNQISVTSKVWSAVNNGVKISTNEDGIVTMNGTTTVGYLNFPDITDIQNRAGKFIFKFEILNNPDSISMCFSYHNRSNKTDIITSGKTAKLFTQSESELTAMKGQGVTGFTAETAFNNVQVRVQIFNLTAMFGAGNEPSTVEEFERIFPNDYYPYNAGEIVSAGTEEVVEQARNLFTIEKCVQLGAYYGFEIDTNKTLHIALKQGKTCPTNVSFGIAYTRGNTMANWLIVSAGVQNTITNSSGMTGSTQIMVVCYPGNKKTMQSIIDAFDITLVDGIYTSDTMPAYTPYHQTTYPIPDTIRNLPGYGWSAGTAKNYVDYENKQYHQCVGAVDLGTLNWAYSNLPFGWGDNQWLSAEIIGIKVVTTNTTIANVLCKKYPTKAAYTASEDDFFRVDKSIGQHQDISKITVLDKSYTDAAAFKQAMSGVILYYELATPIVTDISGLIPDDFLRNIEVEAGGTITFKGGSDDYKLPVPSELEYIVKLSDVGGTT